MSKGELLVKLKLVKAQNDATIELLSNVATLPFSLDDEYEADYLISSLESTSQKLYALASKCRSAAKCGQQKQNVASEQQTERLLSVCASSVTADNCVDQFDVKATEADSDGTASMDSSDVSPPLCGDNVSSEYVTFRYAAHFWFAPLC